MKLIEEVLKAGLTWSEAIREMNEDYSYVIKNGCDKIVLLTDEEGSLFTIDGQAEIVNNYDWTKDINVIDFLRDYGKYFNINYMLAKDKVKSRMETGITYAEFSYMILQALDFMHLYDTRGCTLQVAGSDQW